MYQRLIHKNLASYLIRYNKKNLSYSFPLEVNEQFKDLVIGTNRCRTELFTSDPDIMAGSLKRSGH